MFNFNSDKIMEAKKISGMGLPKVGSVNPLDEDFVVKTGLGHGCDSTGELGTNNCLAAILDYNLLKKESSIYLDDAPDSTVFDLSGDSYQKTTQEVNNTSGIGASLSQGGETPFQANLSIITKNKMANEDTFEYGIKMFINKKFALSITPQAKEKIKDFILKDAWNHINGIADSGSPMYPNDEASLKRLFADYGTHLITKAFYGSKYEYFMLREASHWESDITTQVNMDLHLKFPTSLDGNILGLTPNEKFSQQDTECYDNAQKITWDRKIGGNTSIPELSKWQESCDIEDPSSMPMLGYVYSPSGTSNEDNGLIPLWELVEDPGRRQMMKDAYAVYVKERTYKVIPYKKVITDVYGHLFQKGETAPDYYYATDDTASKPVKRKYFRLDENIFNHVTGVKKGCFYFYYALGHAHTEGLTGIQFMDEKKVNGSEWIRRGNHANENVSGCLTNNVVAIRKAPLSGGEVSASDSELISGFGVKISGKQYKISKGTAESFRWTENGAEWYSSGLVHDSVKCITTTDKQNEF